MTSPVLAELQAQLDAIDAELLDLALEPDEVVFQAKYHFLHSQVKQIEHELIILLSL